MIDSVEALGERRNDSASRIMVMPWCSFFVFQSRFLRWT